MVGDGGRTTKNWILSLFDQWRPRNATVTDVQPGGVELHVEGEESPRPHLYIPSVDGLTIGDSGVLHPMKGVGAGQFVATGVAAGGYTEAEVDALIASYRTRRFKSSAAPGITLSSAGDYTYSGAAITFTGLVPAATYDVTAYVQTRTYGTATFYLLAVVPTGGTLAGGYHLADEDSAEFSDFLIYNGSVADGSGNLAITPGVRWGSGSLNLSEIYLTVFITRS